MVRAWHALAAGLVIALALSTVTGCGGSEEIVRFEGSPEGSISRSGLNHWMQVIAGGEIQRNLGTEGPTGLASEPADYARCFAAAKLVAPRSFFNQLRYDRAQVEATCRELHHAIKAQALSFLIAAHWTMVEAAERHLAANPLELSGALERATGQSHSSREDLRRYLTERHWSLTDLLYQAKLDVLAGKLQGHQERRVARAGDIYATLSSGNRKELADRTICQTGYVVSGCRGYRDPSATSPSPEAILEQLTGKRKR